MASARLREVRLLAVTIAPLLPGEWSWEWQESTQGAYLVSADGTMRLFLSAGTPTKAGMTEVIPRFTLDRNVPAPTQSSIFVSYRRDAQAFAREITRRILNAGYPEKAAEHAAALRAYHEHEDAAKGTAARLAELLGTVPHGGGLSVNAHPWGQWEVTVGGSVHLSVYLPAELALKVAALIRQEKTS